MAKQATESQNRTFQTVNTDDVVQHLRTLGLNSYESKVYLALLKHHPATGYEVSKIAGIPQARAYDTLKALEDQKLAISTQGKPVMYMPASPDEMLQNFQGGFRENLQFLRTALTNFAVETVEPIHNLRGAKSIYTHAVEVIDNAKEALFMDLWGQDQPLLEEAIRRAHDRGVKIFIVGYNSFTLDFVKVYPHDREETIEFEIGWRYMNIAADNDACVVGTFVTDQIEPSGILTKNPTIVTIIKELIIHNLCLLDVEATLKEPMEKEYGKSVRKISRKILGEDILVVAH
jgi:sugar-specific transcriptional regulator TrmB